MLEDIKELLQMHPFEPFRIATAGGDKYDVATPFNVALMEGRLFYAYPSGGNWVFIRLNQITAIESLKNAA